MAHLLPDIKLQFFDDNGDPLSGGKIYSYAAGTSTPLATYTDQGEGTPNANPVILDANGEANIWLGSSSYKFIVKTSADVTLRTTDNVAYIANGDITTGKIADGAVTTAKLAAGAVTQAKLADKTIETQALTGLPSSAISATALTGTLAIVCTGRPVQVGLIGVDATGTPALLKVSGPSTAAVNATIEIFRNLSRISSQTFGVEHANSYVLQEYTTPGTYEWTPSYSGIIYLKGCGGGGGGGRGGADQGGGTFAGGGGGGGSGFEYASITVVSGVIYEIIVGAAGAKGASTGAAGSAGGDTIIRRKSDGAELYRFVGASGGGGGGAAGGTAGAGVNGGGNGGAGGNPGGGASAAGSSTTNKSSGGGYGGGAGSSSGGYGGGGGGGGGAGNTLGGQSSQRTEGANKDGSNGNGGAGGGISVSNDAGVGGDYGAGGGGGVSSGGTPGNGGGGYMKLIDGRATPGDTINILIPASAINIIDKTAPSGTNNYTVKVFVNSSSVVLSKTGTVSLQAYEL